MKRILRIITARRCRLRRLFLYLIATTTAVFIVLSWFDYFDTEKPSEVLRSVHKDYSYYYNINVEDLTAELSVYEGVKRDGRDSFQDHYFNKILSDQLPLDRAIITDTRQEKCPSMKYRTGKEELNNVSVIINYHNEALSVLLRTILSVLHRSPPDLLLEIILIDDFSEKNFDPILLKLPKVKYYKNDLRLGLIKSRNRGADEATGKYLVFLDSHCEVNSAWLEPLLDRLVINEVALVSPVVDIIDPQSLQYKSSTLKLKAGFDWSLRFKWIPRRGEEIERFEDSTRPFVSPVTYGGIFMIRKDWFNQLNQFDGDLDIWGGESVEMSIKAWLCGGQIEIIPCSRVGHIFRKKHPYTFPMTLGQTMQRNSKRIAESWLDEYKKFYYLERPQALGEEIELNLNATNALKDRLQCRRFSWYLQNIFPELRIPNEQHVAYGELKNDRKCLQISSVGQIEMSDCFAEEQITTWALQNNTNLLTAKTGGCLTAYSDEVSVGMEFCKTGRSFLAQQWHRARGSLVNYQTRMCLENLGKGIGMSLCRNGAQAQLWHFAVEIDKQQK